MWMEVVSILLPDFPVVRGRGGRRSCGGGVDEMESERGYVTYRASRARILSTSSSFALLEF